RLCQARQVSRASIWGRTERGGGARAPSISPAPPATAPSPPAPNRAPATPSTSSPPSRSGGYYKDDGPGDNPPANLDSIPDATPRLETLNRFANRPYSVFGVDYVPATSLRPYTERGIASWYGRQFHRQKAPTGARYDVY